MVFEISYPKTPEELGDYITFLKLGTVPERISLKNRWAFERKMRHWELQGELLYLRAAETKPARRFVAMWDTEFLNLLFRQFHDDDRHTNYKKTFNKISILHIGVTREQVRTYVGNCNACKRTSSIKEKDDIIPVVSSGPMEHLQMDLIDFLQYKDANNGYAWLLTIICVFSKFVWAIPLMNKEASTIGNALVQLFSQWGAPAILQSDNGKEFVAEVIRCICASLGIEIRHGRPRHPMSQGQVERLNQTAGRGFTKMLWDENNQIQQVEWSAHLPKFIFSYNTTVHSAHNKTPREVFFGYKLLGIYRTISSQPSLEVEVNDSDETILPHQIERHLQNVTRIHEQANAQLAQSRRYMIKHGSVHRKKTTLEPGQNIAIAPDTDMNPATRKRKLQSNFKDTATVVRLTNNNHTLVVRDKGGVEKRIPVKRARRISGAIPKERELDVEAEVEVEL